jgi:predicted acyl esterase
VTPRIGAVVTAVALLALSAPADAAIPEVFSNTPSPIPCAVQQSGIRLCDQTVPGNPQGTARSTVKSFDGVPIDVRVAFPPQPASGPDGPYPLIIQTPGFGVPKLSPSTSFLNAGYATLTMTTRGFHQSCGTAEARSADPAGCAAGHVHLSDARYEVRDAQELAAQLADEGRTSYTQIGAIGGSAGGGVAMALGALKNRKMLPNGSLVPWRSGRGTPMQIRAAIPKTTFSDLAYGLMPNGTTLDYTYDAPYVGRTGVVKASWESALFNATGSNSMFIAAPGADPDADFRNWHLTMSNGEPYDSANGDPRPAMADIRDELTSHHSPYYIDHSIPPVPMLISSGFTDDLLPADEAIRYYNRTRTEYPGASIALLFGSFGHARGQGKQDALSARSARELTWFNYYVRGIGSPPFLGVTAYTQTCPDSAPSGGPFSATSWQQLAPGEIRFASAAGKTVLANAGSASINATFEPIWGPGACATTSSADQPGAATYRMSPVPAAGFTLMGSPTVIADVTSPGPDSQLVARLLDVDPSTNTQILVARALWRPAINPGPVRQVFQLHANGYRFAAGHVVKLELLPNDYNTTFEDSFARFSDNQQNVSVRNLELRLPVVEAPGGVGGLVGAPAAKVLPPGYDAAAGYPRPGNVRPKAAPVIDIALVPAFEPCTDPDRMHGPALAFPSCNPPQPASAYLTVGTPDNNGRPAGFTGTIEYTVLPGNPATPADEADVRLSATLPDIRKRSGLTGYTGELDVRSMLRVTDGLIGTVRATVQDLPVSVTVPCTSTTGSSGSTCSVATTLDAVTPGAVPEGKRSVWALGAVEVYDGGADGRAATADNTLFARQGVFVP